MSYAELEKIVENKVLCLLDSDLFSLYLHHLSEKNSQDLSTYEKVMFWKNIEDEANRIVSQSYWGRRHFYDFHPELKNDSRDDEAPLRTDNPEGKKVGDLPIRNYYQWLKASGRNRVYFDRLDLTYFLFLFEDLVSTPALTNRQINQAIIESWYVHPSLSHHIFREDPFLLVDLSTFLLTRGQYQCPRKIKVLLEQLEKKILEKTYFYDPEKIKKINALYGKNIPIGTGMRKEMEVYLRNYPFHLRDPDVRKKEYQEWSFTLTPCHSINDMNFCGYPIEEFLDFDRFDYYVNDSRFYTFTRDEFPTLLEKKNVLYTQDELSLRALLEIENRLRLAKELKLPEARVYSELQELQNLQEVDFNLEEEPERTKDKVGEGFPLRRQFDSILMNIFPHLFVEF